MKSDHAAHLSLVHDAQDEQMQIKAKNMDTINKESKAKKEVNSDFFRKVRYVVNFIALLIIAATIYRLWS